MQFGFIEREEGSDVQPMAATVMNIVKKVK